MRVRQPSTRDVSVTYGAMSIIRSVTCTPPSTQLGNGSVGSTMRSCTTYGASSAVRRVACHSPSVTSQPRTMPRPP